jgi:hypothetical protein
VNTLDSRSLHQGDCFAQPFPASAVGEILYVLVAGSLAAGSVPPDTSSGFKIDVLPKAGTAPATQYTVAVTVVDGTLVPTPPSLVIAVGDIVLWHYPGNSPRRFGVVGNGPKFSFSSGALSGGAIYTHVFGSAGTHKWIDSIGGLRPDPRPGGSPATIEGQVVVSSAKLGVEADRRSYLSTLATPASFVIHNNTVTPPEVNIVVGQRVFWQVIDGKGVTVTDTRLVPSAH